MASSRPLGRTLLLAMSTAVAGVTLGSACALDRFGELDISDAGAGIEFLLDAGGPHMTPAATSHFPGLDGTVPLKGDERAIPSDTAVTADVGSLDSPAPGDAAPDSDSSTRCDFNGMWGSRVVIDVSWVPQGLMGVILAPGTGRIKQWTLANRVTAGQSTTETTIVCGIVLPDFSGTQIAGGEKYGIEFPVSTFDQRVLPSVTMTGTIVGSGPGASYSTAPSAALLGLTLANAATAPWPTTVTTEVDSDQDGKPGVTTVVAQGGGYSPVLVDPIGSRADRLYVAIRQVTEVNATALDCDAFAGTVTIPKIVDSTSTAKYAIDSHVIGCRLIADGGDCAATQTAFVDTTQPVFSPSGSTTFASVRLDGNATCDTVRQRLP
jgi:hypothetical protein